MLLSGADGEPRYFDLPEHLCMKVKIEHPTNEGINSMGLEWFGLPGVSSMMLECGGLQFPGAPFAGWYQGTEVASRDFLDPQRYNLLNPIGEAMGLDMSSNTTLWKVNIVHIFNCQARVLVLVQSWSNLNVLYDFNFFTTPKSQKSNVGCLKVLLSAPQISYSHYYMSNVPSTGCPKKRLALGK